MANSSILLGNLLLGAGLLQKSDLEEAIRISNDTKLPIGKVLIMSNFLTEADLKLALDAQSIATQLGLSPQQIVQILKTAKANKVSIIQVIQKQSSKNTAFNKNQGLKSDSVIAESNLPTLARLLISALILKKSDVELALESSKQTNLPLGRVLVNTNKISTETHAKCLAIQYLIKERNLTWNEAAKLLKEAYTKNMSISAILNSNESGNSYSLDDNPFKLGEIITKTNLIQEVNFMQCLELSLINKQMIGEVLVNMGFITFEALNKCLEAQNLLRNSNVEESLVLNALQKAITENISLNDSLMQAHKVKQSMNKIDGIKIMPLYQFLQLSGLANASQIQDSIKRACLDTNLLLDLLERTKLFDTDKISILRECYSQIASGSIKPEQAVIALNFAIQNNIGFSEALNKLNILS